MRTFLKKYSLLSRSVSGKYSDGEMTDPFHLTLLKEQGFLYFNKDIPLVERRAEK